MHTRLEKPARESGVAFDVYINISLPGGVPGMGPGCGPSGVMTLSELWPAMYATISQRRGRQCGRRLSARCRLGCP